MGENGHKQNVSCSSSLCFLDKHIRISDGICPSCAHLQHYCQAAGDPLPKACPSWPDRIVLADQAEFLKTLLQFWFNSVGWRMILWICSAISVRDQGEISHVKHRAMLLIPLHATGGAVGTVLLSDDLGLTLSRCRVQSWASFEVSGEKLAFLGRYLSSCCS